MNADDSDGDDIRGWMWDKFQNAINTIHENTYDTVLEETQETDVPNLVPRWTHPNWPQQGIPLPPEEIVPQEGSEAVIKGDATSRLRPALLPEDKWHTPTRYALRYGIFPDDDFRGPRHGRSRMSPITEAFEHEYDNLDQPAPYSLANIAETIAQFKTNFVEEEVYADDEDYQRALFHGFTTHERINWKSEPLHPDFDPQESNLSGNLHNLLARDQKWLSVGEASRPRYNLCGKTGEYSVDDEELWTALQPALQLVTRVLQMNHPFWRACLDYLCAIEIPEHRKSENHQDKKLIYIDPDEPKDFFRKLGASTRARLALEYLQERIWFSIKSSHHFNVVCTGKRNPDDTTGETVPFHRHNPVNFRLEVVIAAEIMWPLLVPEYNIVEKQNCSLVIGTTILHELAHAAHFAMHAQSADPANPEIRDRAWDDPFWVNEGKAEIGYAFENQLWGGTLKPPHQADIARFLPYRTWPIDICLWQWPNPSDIKDHANSANYLPDAFLPTSNVGTLIQLQDVHRLFQQSFWDNNVPIYGHRALRFPTTGRPSFTAPAGADEEQRRQDWYAIFGLSRGKWLSTAVRAFRAAGYGMVSEYLGHLVDEELVGVRIKSRWDEEKKRWSGRDAKLKAAMEKIPLSALSNMPGESATSVTQMNARSTTQELLSALQDFRSLVLAELQHSQRMTVEFLQLSDVDKSYLQVQLWKLQQRMSSYGRKVHRVKELSLPVKITRWLQIVSLDAQLISSINEVVASLTMLDLSLKQTSEYLNKSTISKIEFTELAKTMPSLVDTVHRSRSQRLQKIAQRDVFNMPRMFRQLWDKFHSVFGRIAMKLQAGTLRVKPYHKRKNKKGKGKQRATSPGTDYDSDLDMDRLNLSDSPSKQSRSPRTAYPQGPPGPAPAPRPTTRVISEREAILSGEAFTSLQIRPRGAPANNLPQGISLSRHNFGNLEIRSRPLPPPAAGAKRGRGDDDDDDEDEQQLPATKRQLRPNQVLPPRRFACPPVGGGIPSSSPAAGASRSASGAIWTSSSSSASDDGSSESSSDDSRSDPRGGPYGGPGGGSPGAGAMEEDSSSDDELIPEEDYNEGDPWSPDSPSVFGDAMDISPPGDNGGRGMGMAARSQHPRRRHVGSDSNSDFDSSFYSSTRSYSSSSSESGIVANDPNLADPFTDAPPPQPRNTTNTRSITNNPSQRGRSTTTPTTPQRSPRAARTGSPLRTPPMRAPSQSPYRTPPMRAPSQSPYRTPPPAYTKTPPVHSKSPRHILEGPRPRRRSTPGHSPLQGPRPSRQPHRANANNADETPPPSFLDTVGLADLADLTMGNLGLNSPAGRPATDGDIRNARTPNTPEDFVRGAGALLGGAGDSPTMTRGRTTPGSAMRGLLDPLGVCGTGTGSTWGAWGRLVGDVLVVVGMLGLERERELEQEQ
ncbi:unnamed protein product [Sordaria macrospora k-hell]|uniref:WGS project CABT00000000 data, contig 2.7 n=1 Tax=Sordaria macrospora (strain ATCC MYA-333 / DSM 997 / K(L3346) / K-hell) TaxID=771870 RepID=F7VUE7_SORMK|nr:uncharacterized protein SMAC_03038 [Sordaria macrospora k-hell]CCC09136.1 unnamed protein product [Sordaria macrospora k-hell]